MREFRNDRPAAFPPVVKNLIIINFLVWLAQLTLNSQFGLTGKLMLYPVQFPQFHPYQLLTHMFAHSPSNVSHILFNMLGLWLFGRGLENVWGPKRFLIFYLVCGLGAGLLHSGIQYFRIEEAAAIFNAGRKEEALKLVAHIGPALGASGAVMGIFAAFAYLFPNTEMITFSLPIPVKAKWLVLIMVAGDLFGGITNAGNDNVAHFAHLGGASTGFLIVVFWNKKNRRNFY